MDFENIAYLQVGNERQRLAYSTLTENNIFKRLEGFSPILVGTIPINIDISSSDLDILCHFKKKEDFINLIHENFSDEKEFTISSDESQVVVNFLKGDFEIEIFAQNIPSKEQFGYRQMLIEYNLLEKYGEEFRQQVIKLKQKGIKTEPAFGILLGLKGNVYEELLKLENSFL